jgi:hypothetical protein
VVRGNLRHLLIHGNGVAVRRAKFSSGQENIDAVVMMTDCSGVVQPADRCDNIAVFFERLQRLGKLVVFPFGKNLIVQRMNAVREVDEGAAAGRCCRFISRA